MNKNSKPIRVIRVISEVLLLTSVIILLYTMYRQGVSIDEIGGPREPLGLTWWGAIASAILLLVVHELHDKRSLRRLLQIERRKICYIIYFLCALLVVFNCGISIYVNTQINRLETPAQSSLDGSTSKIQGISLKTIEELYRY